jgi:hypothetical protein
MTAIWEPRAHVTEFELTLDIGLGRGNCICIWQNETELARLPPDESAFLYQIYISPRLRYAEV